MIVEYHLGILIKNLIKIRLDTEGVFFEVEYTYIIRCILLK
jgi:hypothetical protein